MAPLVSVIALVMLAALVNGNDIVEVIDAVNDPQAADGSHRYSSMLYFQELDVYQRSIEVTRAHDRDDQPYARALT